MSGGRGRALVAGLVVAATLLALPQVAAADTIALGTAPDRAEEVPFLVSASGQGSADQRVFATIKPVGLAGCGPTYGTDADGANVIFAEPAEGNYSVGGTADVDEPGSYLLCGWVQESVSSPIALATTSAVVDVRSAAAALAIDGRKKVRRGKAAKLELSGTAELERDVYATVKRKGKRGCGDSLEVDTGESFIVGQNVQGAFGFRGAVDDYLIDRRGRYLVCAWVEEFSSDLAPEAAARFGFKVRRKFRRR